MVTLDARLKAACADCQLHELCLSSVISAEDFERLDQLVRTRVRVPRGARLFAAGDLFTALYAVRTGFFKTHVSTSSGQTQITGFQMPGELLGLDGVAEGRYDVDAVALVDSEVCMLPYSDLERIASGFPPLMHQLHRFMSKEIVREHNVMLLISNARAEQRLAAFLLNLSARHAARGFSAVEFILCMTRADIGSFLGLTLETVSRALSNLQQSGIISVERRRIRICQPERLASLREACIPC